MNFVADGLLYILNFEQLELYAQKQHNKRASIDTHNDKRIKENKTEIKKLSEKSMNHKETQNREYVTIEYDDGSKTEGKKMW